MSIRHPEKPQHPGPRHLSFVSTIAWVGAISLSTLACVYSVLARYKIHSNNHNKPLDSGGSIETRAHYVAIGTFIRTLAFAFFGAGLWFSQDRGFTIASLILALMVPFFLSVALLREIYIGIARRTGFNVLINKIASPNVFVGRVTRFIAGRRAKLLTLVFALLGVSWHLGEIQWPLLVLLQAFALRSSLDAIFPCRISRRGVLLTDLSNPFTVH
jgi:hypothetical protein